MRSLAYVVALIAAAGIMFYLAMSPQPAPTEAVSEGSTAAAATPDASQVDAASLVSMTLNVPEMHCPFACYPSVKKNLEERPEVASVELVPQKEEGIIDNPQVVVKYAEGFDASTAIALLETAGFSGSTLVE